MKIILKIGAYDVTLDEEDIRDLYIEHRFFMDTCLALANPKVAENSDLDFPPVVYKAKAYEIMKEHGYYDKDFLKEVFEDAIFTSKKEDSSRTGSADQTDG